MTRRRGGITQGDLGARMPGAIDMDIGFHKSRDNSY
jgi:hypothetical protein